MTNELQPVNGIKSDSNNFKQKLFQIVCEDKVLKALVDFVLLLAGIPAGAIMSSAIMGVIDWGRKDKTEKFFKDLSEHPQKLDEKLITNQEFVHKFLITYRYVLSSQTDDKIKFFANMLINSEIEHLTTDAWEEYSQIIDNHSLRELQALFIIDDFYKKYKPNLKDKTLEDQEDLCIKMFKDHEEEFYQIMIQTIGLKKELIRSFLYRLSRNQLYEILNYTFGASPGYGRLTPLFYDIKRMILIKV